jgi:Secretion system C-terminal sorting domain
MLSYAQTAEVILSVNWPQWSSENKVELYSPTGVLLQTIDNGYDGSTNDSYDETTTPVSYAIDDNIPANSGYYVIVYDTYGDGWNGSGTLTITADGENALSFNGSFDTSGTNTEITQTIYFSIEEGPEPFPGISQFDTSGNEYIEYIPGTMPIIISAPHGGVKQSGQTIGGTFYPDNDSNLPDRSCGINERDDNTEILAREIQQSFFDQYGCYPHVIINNLHRSKLDPNREQNEATCSDADALFYWNAFHNFIDQASTTVMNEFGKGLYIDLHGQSHSVPRIEAGYNISATDLNNTTTNHLNTVTNSTITHLVANNLGGLTQEELVRGPNSLGGIFRDTGGSFYNAQGYSGCGVTSGYRTLPSDFNGGSNSCNDTKPFNNAYFDGDYYNNKRHGSGPAASDGLGGGGTIDGIMTEVNRRVRDLGTYKGDVYDTRPQTLVPFADDYATVVYNYIELHYNDFSDFSFTSSTYDKADANPSPVIDGVSGGTFSSSDVGLVIDSNTGIIDLSLSTVGNYTVTYEVSSCSNYQTTQNIEITDNTLTLTEFDNTKLTISPNPATSVLNFNANLNIDSISVYNILGQRIKKQYFNSNEGELNIKDLNVGIYLMKFENKNSKKTIIKRIIKQ